MEAFIWYVGGLVVAIIAVRLLCAAIYTFVWPRR